jgi:hypothetical protein
MSAPLRGAARLASRAFGLSELQVTAQHQQRRFAGDLPVHTNKRIEQWATYREHIPFAHDFKFDTPHLRTILVWGVAVPLAVFTISKSEFDKSDETYGRKKREFL